MIKLKLYSKDSIGRIRIWGIAVETRDNTPYIVIKQGLINNPTEYVNPVLQGKNEGKRNATTPYEQACKDAESKWKQKKKEGYKSLEDLGLPIGDYIMQDLINILNEALPNNSTDDNNNLRPMKCQKFEDNKFQYPAIAQPKLNGFRCVMRLETINDGLFTKQTVTFRSKEGNEYVLPHITDIAYNILFTNEEYKDLVFDGELYIHGKRLNEIKKCIPIRNSNNVISQPSGNSLDVQFHIFDLSIPDMIQIDRSNKLLNIFTTLYSRDIPEFNTRIKLVRHYEVNSDEIFRKFTESWIRQGYEGGVIRDINAEYKFGSRPMTMRKLKAFKGLEPQDKEFLIVDVVQKNQSIIAGTTRTYIAVVCKNDINDETFDVTPEGNEEERLEYLNNKDKYIGKYATVKYYERSGVANVPFHANLITVRDYE